MDYSKDGGTLRQMSSEKLIKTLPTLQNQIDALLDFDVTTNDLNNGVINAAFMLLFRDLIRLFACYNDGIINLLGKPWYICIICIKMHTYSFYRKIFRHEQKECQGCTRLVQKIPDSNGSSGGFPQSG